MFLNCKRRKKYETKTIDIGGRCCLQEIARFHGGHTPKYNTLLRNFLEDKQLTTLCPRNIFVTYSKKLDLPWLCNFYCYDTVDNE